MPFDQKILDEVNLRLRELEVDEIKKRLDGSLIGIEIKSPIFDPGAFLYRGRMFDSHFKKENGVKLEQIIQPPKEAAKLGRLNRANEPVFYCSMNKESVFFELQDLKDNDDLILTFWKTKQRMIVNNIGYTEQVFKELGAGRELPDFTPKLDPEGKEQTVELPTLSEEHRAVLLSQDENREVREAFSRLFMQSVPEAENYKYKLTTAIGEMHLGTVTHDSDKSIRFAGILYPSTRMWANGDNLALQSWFVGNLEFRKAVHVKIKKKNEKSVDISYEDAAHEFDEDGNLKWLGRIQNWKVPPGATFKGVVEAGVDVDGDYESSKDGSLHWVMYDSSGKVVPRS